MLRRRYKKLAESPVSQPTSLIHPQSCPAAKSELMLSHMPPTQASIVKSDVFEYRPLSAVTGSTPLIEFMIPAMADRYTDLDDMFLYIKFRYKMKGVAAGDTTAPVNNLIHSMFSKVDMTIQDKTVTSSSQHYGYKSLLEKLIGYGRIAKETYAVTAGWSKDADPTKPDANRAALYKAGNTIELLDRLHIDLCSQERLMLNAVQIKISLQTNRPSFYIHSDKAGAEVEEVTFEHVALFVKHVEVSEMQSQMHKTGMMRSPALYPICRNEIRQFVLSAGEQHRSLDNVIQGQLPRRIFIMLVENAAENGSINLNPYNFQDFGLNYLACYLNGDQFPSIPYSPDFSNGLCTREYFDLYRSLNQLTAYPNLDISLSEYKKGFTIYGINFTPDMSDPVDGHYNALKRGNLRIDLRFKDALTKVVTVLVFAQFESLITIDRDRNVYTDFK